MAAVPGTDASSILEGASLSPHLEGSGSIVWKAPLPGRGLSSPIVVGDRVIVTASSGISQDRLHVRSHLAGDGSLEWERQYWATGRTMCHPKTSVAAPTPASDGERIYAHFSSNDLVCLDMEGRLLWLRGLALDYPNASNSLGMASSPLVSGHSLVVQSENDSESFAIGLDILTGLNRWRIARPKAANWTSPVLLPRTGSDLVALQSRNGITAIDPGTGQELWEYADGAATIPSSVRAGDVLLVPSRGLTALRYDSGAGNPEQLWRSGMLRPATSSPVVLEGKVFTLNTAGVLTCGSLENGKRLWQLRLKGPFSGTPVGWGKYLCAVSEEGLVQVVDISPEDEGKVVSSLDLGETILCTPALSRDALYVRSDEHLWKLAGR